MILMSDKEYFQELSPKYKYKYVQNLFINLFILKSGASCLNPIYCLKDILAV